MLLCWLVVLGGMRCSKPLSHASHLVVRQKQALHILRHVSQQAHSMQQCTRQLAAAAAALPLAWVAVKTAFAVPPAMSASASSSCHHACTACNLAGSCQLSAIAVGSSSSSSDIRSGLQETYPTALRNPTAAAAATEAAAAATAAAKTACSSIAAQSQSCQHFCCTSYFGPTRKLADASFSLSATGQWQR